MEHSFLIKLADKLQLSPLRINENIDYINTFSEKYSKKINNMPIDAVNTLISDITLLNVDVDVSIFYII